MVDYLPSMAKALGSIFRTNKPEKRSENSYRSQDPKNGPVVNFGSCLCLKVKTGEQIHQQLPTSNISSCSPNNQPKKGLPGNKEKFQTITTLPQSNSTGSNSWSRPQQNPSRKPTIPTLQQRLWDILQSHQKPN